MRPAPNAAALPQVATTDMTSRVPPTNLVRELSRLLPEGDVLHDEESLGKYSHDDAEWAPYAAPLAVVLARSTAEVAAVVGYATAHGIHVVPRGAGTGLSGGANSVENCLIVSLELMTSILEIDAVEGLAVAQAGVINDDLRSAVADHGLWYPPDPASSNISTIGGNAATNAGGICCVKYGVTRDYVRGMTVVLADGEIVHLGRRTAKGVTGYDLTSLLVGSEGTLGIITDVTVKLLPLAGREEQAIIGYFPTLRLAGDAVAAATAAGIVPAALELIDSTSLQAVDDWMDLGLPEDVNVLLMAKIDEPGTTGADLATRLASIFHDAGGTNIEQATDPAEIDRLFLARRMAYPSLERLGPVLTEDVCVPRHTIPEIARPDPGLSNRTRRRHRQHRPCRRWKPPPLDHRSRRGRRRQGPRQDGVRADRGRLQGPGRDGHRRTRRGPTQAARRRSGAGTTGHHHAPADQERPGPPRDPEPGKGVPCTGNRLGSPIVGG